MFSELPSDPAILLSLINTKLRDYYKSLDILCDDMNISKAALTERLRLIDYEYDRKLNQFI